MMLLADSFEDPERARIIYLAAGGLVLVALAVIAGTVWWWRSAAVEHPALAPLEIMGTKSWSKSDEDDRRQRLDSVRPDGAELGDASLIVPDPVDLLDDDRTRPLDFDDLLEFPADDGWRTPDIRRDPPPPQEDERPVVSLDERLAALDAQMAPQPVARREPKREVQREASPKSEAKPRRKPRPEVLREPEPRPARRAPMRDDLAPSRSRVPIDPLLRNPDDY